jgi:hypothetical protein
MPRAGSDSGNHPTPSNSVKATVRHLNVTVTEFYIALHYSD